MMTTQSLSVGQVFSFRKTMTVAEQAMFTGISGNLGALYVDANHARKLGAGGMVAFELAVAALATTSLAKLGGPNRRISNLELSFPEAVEIGASIQAEARVERVESDDAICRIACIHIETGRTVVEGTARLVPFKK